MPTSVCSPCIRLDTVGHHMSSARDPPVFPLVPLVTAHLACVVHQGLMNLHMHMNFLWVLSVVTRRVCAALQRPGPVGNCA
ncbi:hypothetical protein BOTBODRAFT_30785, partial [Botryobasidium botryosum FD-172 SS1]